MIQLILILLGVSVSGPGAPPRVSGEPDQTAVDPATWRLVSLRMPDDRHPGNYYEMELLQPPGWIARNGAAAGRWIDLSLPELGVSGMAQVLGIGPCPPIESGYGRVVLGTFTSVSSDVYELKLAGQDEAIGVTYGHPIWSLDRGDWIAAGALRPGERLATAAGEAVVEDVIAQPAERRVYNLSVEGDRRYLVGDVGVLVHNVNECTPKVLAQMEKAGLPYNKGAVPFRPKLKGTGGEQQILKLKPSTGPKRNKLGYVDEEGRIWIKEYAHAGYPDHWDVQVNGGATYFRVDFNGNLLS